jgi:transcription-repair coupling factor (superfamily II helicase)
MGARDLSVIATPPRNRLPIITEIAQWNDDHLRDAILKEIRRGGQVYVVHDRVQNIEDIAARFRGLLPEIRFAVAHGQMTAHELENVMMTFLEKNVDVLVSTKIIESGLDIPNVNTIVVNRADRFGMAELYQLRGRVGRSNVQAYAYLLTPPISVLPRATLQRLQALQEFNELGSGFNLAMRDLEIRGAGNLLGAEQSGFIEAMGFETYTRILEEAVRELKEEEFKDLFEHEPARAPAARDVIVEAEFDAYIPAAYVGSDQERLFLYRRLYAVTEEEGMQGIAGELEDRFGRIPPEVENLLGLVRIKLVASRVGFPKVHVGRDRMDVVFPPESDVHFYESDAFQRLMSVVSRMHGDGVRLRQDDKLFTAEVVFGAQLDCNAALEKGLAFLHRFADATRPPSPSATEEHQSSA